jgi:hypothetical protein
LRRGSDIFLSALPALREVHGQRSGAVCVRGSTNAKRTLQAVGIRMNPKEGGCSSKAGNPVSLP